MDNEKGLISLDELTPLSQTLITPQLASAFNITSELSKPQAELLSLSSLTHQSSSSHIGSFPSFAGKNHERSSAGEGKGHVRGMAIEAQALGGDLCHGGISFGPFASNPAAMELSRRIEPVILPSQFSSFEKRVESIYGVGAGVCDSSNGGGQLKRARAQQAADGSESEDGDGEGDGDGDSGCGAENSGEDQAARTLKRPRLVWTPQLHKRFVDAVTHLGIKNAVPKTIMQLMNVDGLTRENVASHLQKYRMYLKRMQGLTSEGPSISDQLFASTPIPPALAGSPNFLAGHREDALAVPFVPPMVPLAIPGINSAHIGAALAYGGLDQHTYAVIMRANAQRFAAGDHRELGLESQAPSNSPQRPILTLFPTSSH